MRKVVSPCFRATQSSTVAVSAHQYHNQKTHTEMSALERKRPPTSPWPPTSEHSGGTPVTANIWFPPTSLELKAKRCWGHLAGDLGYDLLRVPQVDVQPP